MEASQSSSAHLHRKQHQRAAVCDATCVATRVVTGCALAAVHRTPSALSSCLQPSLHPTKLGDSAGLLVGQKVFAIGNPFGLDHTLTSGIISGTGREISSGNTGRPIQVYTYISLCTDPALHLHFVLHQ